jgi:zinc/manganese transport system substrate-binding protein
VDIPTDLSRAQGELHPLGNPHYNADPRKGGLIADAIAKGLSRVDPAHAETYAKNRDAFKAEWTAKKKEWDQLAAPVRGKKAISHHADMVYLADYLGLELVGTVEIKPGIAPTAKHLEALALRMKEQRVPLILREVQYPEDSARWLASQTGAKIATVAVMGGAFPDSQTYFGFVEHNLRAIAEAVKP